MRSRPNEVACIKLACGSTLGTLFIPVWSAYNPFYYRPKCVQWHLGVFSTFLSHVSVGCRTGAIALTGILQSLLRTTMWIGECVIILFALIFTVIAVSRELANNFVCFVEL
jgi:hypothetical protein